MTRGIYSPICYCHGGGDLFYLAYKLLVGYFSVEGGNFISKKMSCTCLGFSFLECFFVTTSYQVCKFQYLIFFQQFRYKIIYGICMIDINKECKALEVYWNGF